MVNIEDFIKRLEKILDYYGLTASSFADKIGVQRSSMSHLLSGRNKPSLDFILKILEVFPEVDLYWILNGKGNFPKGYETRPETLFPTHHNEPEKITLNPDKEIKSPENSLVDEMTGEIERIVIFYKNGNFKEYKPR